MKEQINYSFSFKYFISFGNNLSQRGAFHNITPQESLITDFISFQHNYTQTLFSPSNFGYSLTEQKLEQHTDWKPSIETVKPITIVANLSSWDILVEK